MILPTFSDAEIEAQLRGFMEQLGVSPAPYETLILDGHLQRYDIDGDKRGSCNGAYAIHTDGLPAGFVQDWKKGIKATWRFKPSALSPEQAAFFNSDKYKQEQERKQAQRQKEIDDAHKAAAEQARILAQTLPQADENHPYLRAKQVFPYGILAQGNSLAVPLRDIHGNVKAIQWILPDGAKRFMHGAKISGSFWSIGLDTITPEQEATILLGEGVATMAKVYELTSKPCVAAIACGFLEEAALALKSKFPKANIICTADNDNLTERNRGFNPGLQAANFLKHNGLISDIVAPSFDNPQDGSDWDDFALLHGDDETARILNDKIYFALIPPDVKHVLAKTTSINAQDLRAKVFPPVKWAVPGFLPEGLSILAGGPKVGKSILALHLSVGVAIGGCVLGKIEVAKGQVLYLALEDTLRRLQDRINGGELAGDENVSLYNLDIITEIPRQNLGGDIFIRWWLSNHDNARLVIIDTLQMFRKLLTGKGSMYSEDYEAISAIKRIADAAHVPFLILHHLKKGMEGDWLSEISGSQGIAGAADTIFSLKRERNSNLATLHRTGRDVEERDFIMKLDGYGWTLQDDAEAFTMPEWKRQILDFLKNNPSVSPIQLSQAFGLNINTARQNLARLMKEGLIRKTGFGTYGLPEE